MILIYVVVAKWGEYDGEQKLAEADAMIKAYTCVFELLQKE